ncbi:ead/Ea22-like family protein [Klebsiella pneumoniae]
MTDITELALREKFEAWWEREYKHLESSKYTDAVPHIKYGFWMAYQAGGAELVEALEKAQQYAKERDEENQDLMLTIGRFRVEREGLEAIRAAAEKLVRCKGRYHSEQNYRALAALFGVNTPDLPPLDGEPRAVTVENLQESAYRAGLTAGWNLGLANNNDGFNKCLAAHTAGIKWEAE